MQPLYTPKSEVCCSYIINTVDIVTFFSLTGFHLSCLVQNTCAGVSFSTIRLIKQRLRHRRFFCVRLQDYYHQDKIWKEKPCPEWRDLIILYTIIERYYIVYDILSDNLTVQSILSFFSLFKFRYSKSSSFYGILFFSQYFVVLSRFDWPQFFGEISMKILANHFKTDLSDLAGVKPQLSYIAIILMRCWTHQDFSIG